MDTAEAADSTVQLASGVLNDAERVLTQVDRFQLSEEQYEDYQHERPTSWSRGRPVLVA
jgi:hypothetical protein